MNWAYSIRITLMTIRPKKCAAWIPSNLFDPNISIGLTKKKALEKYRHQSISGISFLTPSFLFPNLHYPQNTPTLPPISHPHSLLCHISHSQSLFSLTWSFSHPITLNQGS